ncbi:MAG: ABC transporter substrate-binding protein [Clostridia bacterium]|nr:ABC transporter substrate-binding protein [Clostridia bacterium]
MQKGLKLIALCLAALLSAACAKAPAPVLVSTPEPPPERILVGRVVPVTGRLASFGSGTPYVEQAAIDYINNSLGGVYIEEAGQKLPLELIWADSESDVTKAAEAAVKLIVEDGVDVMIVSNTVDTVNPVSAACERYGVPCISTDAPVDAWLDNGPYEYSFHAFFNTENEMLCFIDAWNLADTNQRVGLLTANDSEGVEIATALPPIASSRGYSIVDPGRYAIGAEDYSQIIQALKSAYCDIVVGVMTAPDFAVFWRQCAELDYRPKLCTIAKGCLFASDVQALGPLGDGLISEVWWSPDFPYASSITGQSSRELSEDYLANTSFDFVPATLGYKHANIELLYDILRRAASLDPARICAAAADTDLSTVVGRIRFGANHACVMTVATGQWVLGEDGRFSQSIIANTQIPEVPLSGGLRPLG